VVVDRVAGSDGFSFVSPGGGRGALRAQGGARGEERVTALHDWQVDAKQAVELQQSIRDRLVLAWDGREVSRVGGVDVSVRAGLSRAAIVVLAYPELTPIASATAERPVAFPYIPGLLSFREGPVALAAWERLPVRPHVLLFDGQGIAHPRGIGLAAHVGLWLRCPSIGVAKTRLYGVHVDPGRLRGEAAELRAPPVSGSQTPGPVIGAVLRTRTDVKPVYVSPGHLMDLPHAVAYTLGCCTRYRLPEPIRWAHQVAGGARLAEIRGNAGVRG
jgi:deoxyribonuclease V